MAILGSTAKPTTFQEGFGLNSTNQMAMALTLPAGGPWNIEMVGGWLGGWNESVTARWGLWSASGSLLWESDPFTVANEGGIALGALSNYEKTGVSKQVDGGDTVYVGFWRHPSHSTQNGQTGSGTHIHDASTSTGGAFTFSGFSSHTGKIGFYLEYVAADEPPDAPTILEPDSGEVVNDTGPTIDWNTNDPDGDPQTNFELQIDNNSGFGSPIVDHANSTATTQYTVPGGTLTRGTTYYVRVRTKHNNVWSPWTGGREFTVASLPIATVTSPGTDVAAPLYYTAGSDSTPKFKVSWTFSCDEGGSQTSASVKVYDSAGSSLLHTHAHSGSSRTNIQITGFSPTNGTKYQIAVTPTCSHGPTGNESAKKRCQVRWGRASYRADLGAAPVTLAVTSSATSNSGTVAMEFASSAATTPEPTDWKATVAEVSKQRYIWHRVTLLPEPVASPTSPALNAVTITYSANALTPDRWTLDAAYVIDVGTFVYGTQSLKHTGDGTSNDSYQDVTVTADTDYVLSARIKTVGAAGASILLTDPDTGEVLASISATSDTDWTRYNTPVWNSGGRTSVRVVARATGAGGTTAWWDAFKLEASTVVTPWTPGFLGESVVLDSTGIMVDAALGGKFRLRASTANGTVELSEGGLRIDSTGDADLSSTDHPFQVGPTSGDNIVIDRNEILARNNGAADTLFLQASGGGTTDVGGQLIVGGAVFVETVDDPDIIISGNNYIVVPERSAGTPSAADANTCRIFAIDNGSGKVSLRVRFPTGTVTLATEA